MQRNTKMEERIDFILAFAKDFDRYAAKYHPARHSYSNAAIECLPLFVFASLSLFWLPYSHLFCSSLVNDFGDRFQRFHELECESSLNSSTGIQQRARGILFRKQSLASPWRNLQSRKVQPSKFVIHLRGL